MKLSERMNLKKTVIHLIIPGILLCEPAYSHEEDDPQLASLLIDKLEQVDSQTSLEAQAWIGKDLNKLWMKGDIENHNGETKHAELQALYSHTISAYWDFQAGVRQDTQPTTRTWSVIGLQGVAPYFFDVDAAIFVGESGRTAARFSAEYDLLFTQKLILSPEIEINFFGQNDAASGTGSGLSTLETGLRLRYEIRRELAPYVGVVWDKKYGATADFAKKNNESISESTWVLGLRAWF